MNRRDFLKTAVGVAAVGALTAKAATTNEPKSMYLNVEPYDGDVLYFRDGTDEWRGQNHVMAYNARQGRYELVGRNGQMWVAY